MVLVSAIALLLGLGALDGAGSLSICALHGSATPAQTTGDASTLDCESLIKVGVARAAMAPDEDTWWLEIHVAHPDRGELQAFLAARQRRLVAYIASGRQLGLAMVMGSDSGVLRLGFDSEADASRALDALCAAPPDACTP